MGYWQTLLAQWKVALASASVDAFFVSNVENRAGQRTTYQSLGSIQAYTDYLIAKAAAERLGSDENIMGSLTFGVTRAGQL
jgi:hypothetical protein